jgi:hypothetical protein
MFFLKRKQWEPPSWRVEANRKQRMYAKRLADFLGRKAAKVPPARLRVWVVVCLLLMGAGELSIGLRAFEAEGKKKPVRSYDVFAKPILAPPIDPAGKAPDLVKWLDSIRRDPILGPEFDSLTRDRPGLLDTLRRLGYRIR